MTDNSTQASGIELEQLDERVRPQDDLFRHVNGKWIAETEIPADKSSYGSFYILRDEAEAAVREILDDSASAEAGSEQRKMADAYAAFMDEDRLAQLGADPIMPDLRQVMAVDNLPELMELIGRHERDGVGGFFGLYVIGDVADPDTNLLYIEQAGLGLPDEAYYREEQYAEIREAYRAHIERMFELVSVPGAAERAERVFELETAIASHHWDVVRSREADLTYNPTTFDELRGKFDGEGFARWFAALEVPAEAFARFSLNEPSFADGLAELLVDEQLERWRDWLLWRIVLAYAAVLSPEISAANFAFFGTTLTGVPQQRERWRRGVGHVESMLGEAIAREYVARHFKPEAKAQMDALVADLLGAYRDSISQLSWMSAETRDRALEKLSKFTPKIGYPVKWRDYSALQISATDLIANVRASARFDADWEWSKVGKPVDRDLWLMTPQTVNAYYLPHQNEIVFPAAILQLPFFSPDRDAAANFGAIGAVIGHEIGHGFDDQGSKYDGDGRLIDWWTDADREAFEKHTASLIDQYNGLSPEGADGECVNGELTIGENIGDLGGLGIAWKAYLRHLDGAEPEVIDGLTAAQRFFYSWAQAWRDKKRPEMTKMLLAVDPHSPAEFRCNQIVSNLDPFYEAFDVQPGDRMWLAPEQRVEIW